MQKQPPSDEIPKGYLRVTEVLGTFTDFSHINPATLANAADRGTRAHKFCELYLRNLLLKDVDQDCKGYFESFVKWYEEIVDETLLIEQRFNCKKHKITGQIDLILKIKGDESPLIVDLKTPQTPAKSWRLQTAAYLHLAKENWNKEINRRACLILDKNGGDAKFNEYTNEKDSDMFFNALELVKFFK